MHKNGNDNGMDYTMIRPKGYSRKKPQGVDNIFSDHSTPGQKTTETPPPDKST